MNFRATYYAWKKQPVFIWLSRLIAFQLLCSFVTIPVLLDHYHTNGNLKRFEFKMPYQAELKKRSVYSALQQNATTVMDNSTITTTTAMTTDTTMVDTSAPTTETPTTTTTTTTSTTLAQAMPTMAPFTTQEITAGQRQDPIVRKCTDNPDQGVVCNYDDRDRTLTLFLLGFFVGILGVDRCVAGFWVCGVFKCLTCGGLGIWALVDWICVLALGWVHSYNGCCFADNMGL